MVDRDGPRIAAGAGAERLGSQTRRRHAEEAETPEDEVEHDRPGVDGAEKVSFAKPADVHRQ